MAKCDVCGKNSLQPERLGNSNICKMCFMKVNGPVWKYRTYEKYGDAEKWRDKALDFAAKQDFPYEVMNGINLFFNEQIKDMLCCDVCGEVVQTLEDVGQIKMCKKCFNRINTGEWKQKEYEDNQAVEANRNKVLKIANKHNYPQPAIEAINQHFDSKIQEGLMFSINGGRGQILKVYEKEFVLITSNNFDFDEMESEYIEMMTPSRRGRSRARSEWEDDSLVGDVIEMVNDFKEDFQETVDDLLEDIIPIHAIRNMKNKANPLNFVSNMQRQLAESKVILNVQKGTLNMSYKDYDMFKVREPVDGEEIGFLKIQNSKYANDPSSDVVFFFDNYEHIKLKVRDAAKYMKTRSTKYKKAGTIKSPADELLKYKKLLDMGAITQEEFDKKKKELLDL